MTKTPGGGNKRFPFGPAAATLAVFAVLTFALSNVRAVPVYETKQSTVTRTEMPLAVDPVTGEEVPGGDAVGDDGVLIDSGASEGLACKAGRNGGETDTGVSASRISVGATVVRSGIGSSFLGGAPVAMQALVDKVNRGGGVCGRLIDLKMIDDGWEGTRGVTFLRSLIDQGVFALTVSPSSEGVNALIKAGDLKKRGVPLIGADGMVKSMYKDPWVWPVATSTVSTMHLMVQEAYKRGARTFGLVFAKDYAFGVEGAIAYNTAVKRFTGKNVPGFNPGLSTCRENFCGILSGQGVYSSEVNEFNSSCQSPNPDTGYGSPGSPGTLPNCDVVALLLEPKTALKWLQSGGAAPENRMTGPQPLFNADFAKSCGRKCEGMVVWTSYNPPLDPYRNLPAVADYVQTVRLRDPSLDIANSFTQGAYLGMKLFVEAAERVGPRLTRKRLQTALDTQTFDLGLGPVMRWARGNHLGNGQMQSYALRYQGSTFVGFNHKDGFVKDSLLGKDM